MNHPKNKPLPFMPEGVCPLLQTKALALNTNYETTAFEQRAEACVAIFYCMTTMTAFGPDDDDVGPEECCKKRGCWAGDPEL